MSKVQLKIKTLFISTLLLTNLSIAKDASSYLPKAGEIFSYKDITPKIWDATEQNMKLDPMNHIYKKMRENRKKAMSNPNAPQAFSGENVIQNEFASAKEPWQNIEDVFNADWSVINSGQPKEVMQLKNAIKVKTVLNHPDIKIIEMALSKGAILPLHADLAPGAYHIIEGSAKIAVNGKSIQAFTGTSIKLDSLSERRIETTSDTPLKLLWFRWAPSGNQIYLDYGYYLTGSNFHLQPLESVMPDNYEQWKSSVRKPYKHISSSTTTSPLKNSYYAKQKEKLNAMKQMSKYNKYSNIYPTTPLFSNELDVEWLDFENIPSEGFFWAKDAGESGEALSAWNKMTRMKGIFQAKVPQRQFDFNFSYIATGPTGKYVTHSHATPEFYYILGGKTEWIINKHRYIAVPGNVYFHNPYIDHEMRGLEEGNPEIVITGSWAPFGDRSVFKEPMLFTEALPTQAKNATLDKKFDFHNFNIMKNLKFKTK